MLEIKPAHSWFSLRRLTGDTAGKMRTLCASPDEVRAFPLSASNDVPRSRERERVAEGRVRDVGEKHIAADRAGVRCRSLPLPQLLDAPFVWPEVLRVPPISDHGQPGEIIQCFGGADQLRNAVNQLDPVTKERLIAKLRERKKGPWHKLAKRLGVEGKP